MRIFLLSCLMAVSLLTTLTDLAERRIPNRAVLALAALGCLDRLSSGQPLSLTAGALIAAAGAALSWPRFGRDAPPLGLGDVKLTAALSFWLGKTLFRAVAAAFLLAFPFALLALLVRRKAAEAEPGLPFAPFLLVAAWALRFTASP